MTELLDNMVLRMLAVEKEAADIVSNAQKKAEQIHKEGKEKRARLKSVMQKEIALEAGALIEGRIEKAEREKQLSLDILRKQLDEKAAIHRHQVQSNARTILQALAYCKHPINPFERN